MPVFQDFFQQLPLRQIFGRINVREILGDDLGFVRNHRISQRADAANADLDDIARGKR